MSPCGRGGPLDCALASSIFCIPSHSRERLPLWSAGRLLFFFFFFFFLLFFFFSFVYFHVLLVFFSYFALLSAFLEHDYNQN